MAGVERGGLKPAAAWIGRPTWGLPVTIAVSVLVGRA